MNIAAIVAGVEYDLSDGSLAWLQGDDDLGMADLRRLSERGPNQHGDTDLGFYLEPRQPALIFGLEGESETDLWNRRRQLIGLFKPASAPVILKCTLDNGDVRQLDCHYLGGMKMPYADRQGTIFQKVAVVFKASDPTYYDPVGIALSFALGGGSGSWEFPWVIPWTIGASSIDQSIAVGYAGSFPTFPTLIRIIGPITNPLIENETTNEKLDFNGITIAGGDYYDLDLRYGHKTVVDSNGANKLADLTDDSDLEYFHIEADPDAPGGENSIHVSGTGITATTKIEIVYFNRYIGI